MRIGDILYGSVGDFGPAVFCAVNVHTGEILWKRRDIGRVGMLQIGEQLLMLEESGRLLLATASSEGLTIHTQADVLQDKAWTIPTLIGKRLYLRDQSQIMAMELP